MSVLGRFLAPLGRALEATFAWATQAAGRAIVSVVRVMATATRWAIMHPTPAIAIGITGLIASYFIPTDSVFHPAVAWLGWWMLTCGAIGWGGDFIARAAAEGAQGVLQGGAGAAGEGGTRLEWIRFGRP